MSDLKRIAIIGAGPGGTACALKLHKLASSMGKSLDISIIEGKQFSTELHQNQCVGVLSHPIAQLLEVDLGIDFPRHLTRNIIDTYVLHSQNRSIDLKNGNPSTALRRVEFDAYMLEEVKKRGIRIIPGRAVDIEFHDSSVIVFTENIPLEAEVVVGAFGMDEGTASIFERATHYHPPKALSSVVTKYHPGPGVMDSFGSSIHAFLPSIKGIEFGGITPKGKHLAINIAGKSVDSRMMDHFLELPTVIELLGGPATRNSDRSDDLCYFKGRIASSLADHYYGDRYVIVGDAAGLVRPFKGKGVTSAILSGKFAAETCLMKGITRQAFHSHYRPANEEITRDLFYGKMARMAAMFILRSRILDAVLEAAKRESHLKSALYGAVSGHTSYREVFRQALSGQSISQVLRALFSSRTNRPEKSEQEAKESAQ